MNKRFIVGQIPEISAHDLGAIEKATDDAVNARSVGFIIRGGGVLYEPVLDMATGHGLVGDKKESRQFDYYGTWQNPDFVPGEDDWIRLGVTELHADGGEGQRMLSVAKVKQGKYDLISLKRGPATKDIELTDMWEVLNDQTQAVLNGEFDPDLLAGPVVKASVSKGDLLVINPSDPHLGVTREAPRVSDVTFFYEK